MSSPGHPADREKPSSVAGPSGTQRTASASSPPSKKSGDASSSSSSSPCSDEELDFSSSKFDAFKALYSPRLKVGKGATLYDNVDKLVAVREGRVANRGGRGEKSKKQREEEESHRQAPLQRQFLPSQQMVQGERKEAPNLLKYMKRQEGEKGPMSRLAQLTRDGSGVQVCTRGLLGERGRCRGFLMAFDKHWNLALSDVDETFVRRRRGKSTVLEGDGAEAVPPRREEGTRRREERVEFVGESRVRVIKTMRKKLVCQRHVPQLLVRGEHVVFVSADL